jgi:hypothetical protein
MPYINESDYAEMLRRNNRQLDELDTLRTEHATAQAEVARLRNLLDIERYKVAIGIQSVAKVVQGRQWLSEPGRGCYLYDDERYQAEFGGALKEIDEALAPLRAIARDWSDCPKDPLQVAANRRTALGDARAALTVQP